MFTEEAILANENVIAEFFTKMILKYGDDIEAEEKNNEKHKAS